MFITIDPPYEEFDDPASLPSTFILRDHASGFDINKRNAFFDSLDQYAKVAEKKFVIYYCQLLDPEIKQLYKNIDFKFSFSTFAEDWQHNRSYFGTQYEVQWRPLEQYNIHPELNFKNFICSFNGTQHVGRKLLLASIDRFGWNNPETITKNFTFGVDELDGHLYDYVGDRVNFYGKFFVGNNSETFFQSINNIGYTRYKHDHNIYQLESALTSSFIHVVSESLATSYVPFVTEKFLYSIVTRGLFLAYAQPGWHRHIEQYYGFKLYNRLFDYRFDTIENPVERLIELMSMLSKFSILTSHDWHDLYQLEQETIEYNYDHYHSKRYLQQLRSYE